MHVGSFYSILCKRLVYAYYRFVPGGLWKQANLIELHITSNKHIKSIPAMNNQLDPITIFLFGVGLAPSV